MARTSSLIPRNARPECGRGRERAHRRRLPSVGRTGRHRATHAAVLHDAGAQHAAHQLERFLVADAFLDPAHQPVVWDRLETRRDVGLHKSTAGCSRSHRARPATHRAVFWVETEAERQEVGLEDRLDDDHQGSPHDAVGHRRNRQRTTLVAAGLGNPHPTRGQRPIRAIPNSGGQLVEQPVHAVPLDIRQCHLVDACCAAVAAHLTPRPLQDVPAVDLVIERVEATSGFGLGRPVQRSLQFSDLVKRRG
jgi:hypothetical protein